ncbi:MAG: hypothetical protein MJ239_06635 [Bacilli bacterium]|nr:hypothetical protein [Bacilli bacterium]
MEKTSLEKSHSKSSNAKLTFLCFLASIFSSSFVAGLAIFNGTFDTRGYIALGVSAASLLLSLLFIRALKNFTR